MSSRLSDACVAHLTDQQARLQCRQRHQTQAHSRAALESPTMVPKIGRWPIQQARTQP